MNIVIISPGMRHDGNTIKKESLGGSETAAIQLAEAIAKRKDKHKKLNRVVVFSPCEQPVKVNNVNYIPIQAAKEYVQTADIDLLIVSRAIEFLSFPHNAKVCYLWCHDLAGKRFEAALRGIIYQIDKILVMSTFQRDQYKEVYNLPDDAFQIIRNGIDLGLFPAERSPEDRHKGLMVYAARPERGLENLVKPNGIMEKLLKASPDITLMVAHYDNTTEQMRQYYHALWQRCEELPNVKMVGCLTKDKLYDLYSRAWIYCYPTPAAFIPEFDEISCISAMEAQACGLPFVTTKRGALVETVKEGTGIIVDGNGQDESTQNEMIEAIIGLLRDDSRWLNMSEASYRSAKTLAWEPIGQELVSVADQILEKRSSDLVRLYKHFYRMSDIEMCRELDKVEGGVRFIAGTERERQSIASDWSFTESPALYREHYIKVDEGASVNHYDSSEGEPRWLFIKEWLSRHGKKFKNVLDFGCWIGHQTIRIANELPDAKVEGWDVTKRNIDLAHECNAKYSKHNNVLFQVYDEMAGDEGPVGQYDCVFVNEVLEHVIDPYALIKLAERWCKQGGMIFVTTPYGPWEYQSYKTFPHRCHLRHFELADLMDIFEDKKDLSISYRPTGADKQGTPLGHHYVFYENDLEKATGKVSVERKMKRQAPRDTLSVCMIAHNAESMLHRTLKSVRDVADEIIIAVDPKTTDSTAEIARSYGAKVIGGVNPMEEGFETARNESIRPAVSDWILWIDSDEELLRPEMLAKYLRPSILNAYAIQQHHLSVDPPMNLKPDLPMRLFRSDRGIKFYGVVHEHPEHEYNKGVGYALVLSDCWIAHDGYLTEEIRKKRFLRNIDLVIRDREKYPDRHLGKFLWLRDLIHLCRYRAQQFNMNGGPVMDSQILAWAREAQELYERTYLENPNDPMAQEAINYYSEANKILGQGVPLKITIGVEGKEPTQVIAQFRNSDSAAKFMHAVSKGVLSPFEARYM